MKIIKEKNIEQQALKLYNEIESKKFLQKRCLNFELLEKNALEWENKKILQHQK